MWPPDVTHFTNREAELGSIGTLLTTPVPTVVINAVAGTLGIRKTSHAVGWSTTFVTISPMASSGEEMDETYSLRLLGAVQRESGRLSAARDSIQQSLTLGRELGHLLSESLGLIELGRLQIDEGRPADSLESSQRAATILRQLGHRGYEARALDVTGEGYQRLGRLDDAIAFHRRAAGIHRDLGNRWLLAVALDKLAAALSRRNRPDEARQAWREALDLLTELSGPRRDDLLARINQRDVE